MGKQFFVAYFLGQRVFNCHGTRQLMGQRVQQVRQVCACASVACASSSAGAAVCVSVYARVCVCVPLLCLIVHAFHAHVKSKTATKCILHFCVAS